MIAGTLQTDPRSGGIKRSSGVQVLPEVSEAWSQVRDNANPDVNWLICSYVEGSKTDITVYQTGPGGQDECAAALPAGKPCFGGLRLPTGRFVGFAYTDDDVPAMQKGRASLHKNGVLNVLEGRDGEIELRKD